MSKYDWDRKQGVGKNKIKSYFSQTHPSMQTSEINTDYHGVSDKLYLLLSQQVHKNFSYGLIIAVLSNLTILGRKQRQIVTELNDYALASGLSNQTDLKFLTRPRTSFPFFNTLIDQTVLIHRNYMTASILLFFVSKFGVLKNVSLMFFLMFFNEKIKESMKHDL